MLLWANKKGKSSEINGERPSDINGEALGLPRRNSKMSTPAVPAPPRRSTPDPVASVP
jgi:hypothetical protein